MTRVHIALNPTVPYCYIVVCRGGTPDVDVPFDPAVVLQRAQITASELWTSVVDFAHLHSDDPIPNITRDTHLQAATDFRAHMDRECTKDVCAVCSCYKRACDVTSTTPSELVGLHLLDASRPKTDTLPRAALTTVTISSNTYCLQPVACQRDDDGTITHIKVCIECKHSLASSRVPNTSLVAFDTG